jgi:hypothetical protein
MSGASQFRETRLKVEGRLLLKFRIAEDLAQDPLAQGIGIMLAGFGSAMRLAARMATGLWFSGNCSATRVISNATFATRVSSALELASRKGVIDMGAALPFAVGSASRALPAFGFFSSPFGCPERHWFFRLRQPLRLLSQLDRGGSGTLPSEPSCLINGRLG